ncbi:hypothetical protein HMPREF1227_1867 [Streptococcus pyogenes GA41046]|nr:hypothetical protein HMPREF1227_1867 [Streptococcus pyogenes GA41046]
MGLGITPSTPRNTPYADFSKATERLVVLSVKLRWLVTKKSWFSGGY